MTFSSAKWFGFMREQRALVHIKNKKPAWPLSWWNSQGTGSLEPTWGKVGKLCPVDLQSVITLGNSLLKSEKALGKPFQESWFSDCFLSATFNLLMLQVYHHLCNYLYLNVLLLYWDWCGQFSYMHPYAWVLPFGLLASFWDACQGS